jgi:hypothetical protein
MEGIMPRLGVRSIQALVAVGILAGCGAWPESGFAAAAYPPGQQLSTQAITDFTGNPSQILSQFPNGGAQMIARLRDLLASDPATLSAIVALIANANKEQKAAMGAALAQAAKLYAGIDPTFAVQIQRGVANTQDQEVILAFAAAAGDLPIAAGVGGGFSAGGVGGQTGPFALRGLGGGAIEGIGGGDNVASGQFTGISGNAAAAGTSSNGTNSNTSNNTSNSVSP